MVVFNQRHGLSGVTAGLADRHGLKPNHSRNSNQEYELWN